MSSSLSRLQVIPQEARGRVNKKSRTDWYDSIKKKKEETLWNSQFICYYRTNRNFKELFKNF